MLGSVRQRRTARQQCPAHLVNEALPSPGRWSAHYAQSSLKSTNRLTSRGSDNPVARRLLLLVDLGTAQVSCIRFGSLGGFLMRTIYSAAIGCLLAGCGNDTPSQLVKKPSRPNPFPGYERQITYAKDWHRMSHHLRAITVAHWSHAAGFNKSQSNALAWCLKDMAESADASTKTFDEAKSNCISKAKAKQSQ